MSRSVTTAGVLALALALSASTAALAQEGEPTTPVENPNTGESLGHAHPAGQRLRDLRRAHPRTE